MLNLTAFDDNELIRRAQGGESRAFHVLIERHTARLYRIVRRMSNDRMEAEEVVQEAWLRAWSALPRYQTDRPLWPWLSRIALNAARDLWRARRPLDFADLGPEEPNLGDAAALSPEMIIEREHAAARLANLVERLRPEHRAVIALRYEAELSYQEIARVLAIPVNTVRTHLRRAKATLRDWLETENHGLDG